MKWSHLRKQGTIKVPLWFCIIIASYWVPIIWKKNFFSSLHMVIGKFNQILFSRKIVIRSLQISTHTCNYCSLFIFAICCMIYMFGIGCTWKNVVFHYFGESMYMGLYQMIKNLQMELYCIILIITNSLWPYLYVESYTKRNYSLFWPEKKNDNI